MTASQTASANRNVALYPWFKLFRSLMFTQAVWFLYFQTTLTPAQAIMLYAIGDLATTVLEVPSGYASDRIGRRFTLLLAGICSATGALLLGLADSFAVFVLAQVVLGAGGAFISGTDSAFLYESLSAAGREAETEAQELKAWRFSFTALALSAATGGAIALYSYSATFVLTAVCMAASFVISLQFRDQHGGAVRPQAGEVVRFGSLRTALKTPVLIWLFALSVLMYVFSHIPYVFGQPFIQDALNTVGLRQEAPWISGIVTTTMMIISVIASLFAKTLRDRIGLIAILLLAFGMQIALSGVLALTNAPIVIAILLLRMVPDAFSRPFIVARIQPELNDDARATYLSLQSLGGRILFATTLFLASASTEQTGDMAFADIQFILGSYVVVGIICLSALAIFARGLPINAKT
ncbi:MFS transporter [Yoonia sp. F2084L]|uniref:MFS transporter n=1 Tax=Yoonia sp. F2084L TaxID=2926419 RepID=UPI001FF6498B|nr:MFS transporter [Yoonia sp. F2084L]MCK0094340.1 MFS transporter [Yoonia sp. F2084L]